LPGIEGAQGKLDELMNDMDSFEFWLPGVMP